MVKAVVGANWGDEGKGKITDMLAEKADIIVRFQGGANAGHTIVNNYGKFALHTLPSGVFYNHTTSVIGNGVALNIPILMKEIKSITDRNVPMPKILVSDRAQMVMPYHILFDQYEEERLGGKSFGSTKSGIAPFYSDKYAKIGFQVSELFDEELLQEKVQRVSEMKNVILEHLYHKPMIDPAELLNTLHEYRDMIAPFVCDVSAFLDKALKEGKTILLEGQLGTMKDPDHGIYPMVTSSSTLAAYGAIGAGIPPYEIKQIVTVSKAYSSSVGAGAFVSEIFGDEADELRHRGGDGGEFGATTGRPRRMGWFDCVATKYGCRLQGATDVAFTVLDALGYLDEIPVCVGYEIDGEVTTDFPVTYKLEKAKPVLKKLPGWKCDIRGIRNFDELPENCRKYVEFIEEQIGFPITMVSNGPGREDIIYRSVTSTKCCLCGKSLRKKIRWFTANQKMYFSLAVCPEHGYLKGKIRIKKADGDRVFAVKTLKLTDEEGAAFVVNKKEELRKKRAERSRAKRLRQREEAAAGKTRKKKGKKAKKERGIPNP